MHHRNFVFEISGGGQGDAGENAVLSWKARRPVGG
jgi:hypothetical protein